MYIVTFLVKRVQYLPTMLQLKPVDEVYLSMYNHIRDRIELLLAENLEKLYNE